MATPKVSMPEANYNNRNAQDHRNRVLVPKFGAATVSAAESSVVLDILIMVGIVKADELIELVQQKCQKIDDSRRRAARIEGDES